MSLGATTQAFNVYSEEQWEQDSWDEIMGRDDVKNIEDSPRFLLLQTSRLEKEVKQNHDSQNEKREALERRVGKIADRVRENELWVASNTHLLEQVQKTQDQLEKLRGNFFRLALIVSAIAGSAGFGAGVLLP